jgi:hypothetical protein
VAVLGPTTTQMQKSRLQQLVLMLAPMQLPRST